MPWYVFVAAVAFVVAMLIVDLRFFHGEDHEPTAKEAGTWLAVWVAMGIAFGLFLLIWKGSNEGGKYFAGYLIEYSLSVDNMFVFVVIFTYFQVPSKYQHQVLFFGILGAIVFRGAFILLGIALVRSLEWIVYLFGAFLLITAFRMVRGQTEVSPEDNPILRFLQKRLPTTSQYHDGKFWIKEETGRRVLTPLLIVLIFIDLIDIAFAIDSIPAILAITTKPYLVLTSNMFAILGLRALYFFLAKSVDRFHLLKYGLAVILAFVGVKMLLGAVHVEISTVVSLIVIALVLATTVVLSLKIEPKPASRAEDGQRE
ncbi:MAG TPA: TerC family protein [Actinomycetota bacterium]|nr:TerC family protein [Actinomycetota bacterium]